jgi:hypothetical protein
MPCLIAAGYIVFLCFFVLLALILGLAVCTMRRKDTQKKFLQMFPDDDIRETIINYADGAGEENTVINSGKIHKRRKNKILMSCCSTYCN